MHGISELETKKKKLDHWGKSSIKREHHFIKINEVGFHNDTRTVIIVMCMPFSSIKCIKQMYLNIYENWQFHKYTPK